MEEKHCFCISSKYFPTNTILHLLLQCVVRDARGPLGRMGHFEHQVINELLSGRVAAHGRGLAHLRTNRRAHLTVHQRHLERKNTRRKTEGFFVRVVFTFSTLQLKICVH